jgi:hypothetical protein
MEHTPPRRGFIVMATGILKMGDSGTEDYLMRRRDRYISTLCLSAAMIAPALFVSQAKAQEVQLRVYDRDHRDYHNWDDREDRSYRVYLGEQHRDYREYNHQNHRVQRNYWNWRHSHPDHD